MRIFQILPALALGQAACGTLPNGHRWGEDATLLPGLGRIRDAALGAALEPGSWAPAIGALILTVDHFDRKVSNWAARHNPIFGDRRTADDASDFLYDAQLGLGVVSGLGTPSGDQPGEWLLSKSKGLGIEAGAVLATAGVTEGLKTAIGRARPNGRGNASFPSGHTSSAFALATLTSRNLDSIDPPARWALQASSYTLAGTVGWARVEAQKHFPTDVLAGAALGHFLAAFIHDAFLGLGKDDQWTMEVNPMHGGATLELGWRF